MTALCGGGTSGALPGAQAVTLLASGALAVVLQRYGAGWLQWALPFLSLPELTLTTFCGTDPPAIPTFTAAESKALTDLQLGADFNSGLSKFSDLIQHLAWYDLCQCTSGALTPLPAAPAPPAGTPVYKPAPALPATACWHWHTASSIDNTVFPNGFNLFPGFALAPAMDALRVTITNTVGVAPGVTVTYNFGCTNAAGVSTGSFTKTLAPGAPPFTIDLPLSLGSANMGVTCAPDNAAGRTQIDLVVDGYCNGSLPGGTASPCTPDAATQLALDQILRMVTLLQRQLVPFAYISSTAHAGLTGQGTIAIQGLLGLRIDLTTMPGSLTQDASTPPFVYNVGWVSLEDANGFIDETRAHAQHQNWFSRIASEATLIGYSFAPGVIATITELQREP